MNNNSILKINHKGLGIKSNLDQNGAAETCLDAFDSAQANPVARLGQGQTHSILSY